ncbi:glycosyltransferase [Natronosporangium hydrolyticum]|uniref:Glycosyltransferase n=1 Tax=Natronosporangium hydrolyticum TaxID=2811111 RepID=A0A895YC13_9ACTN|nr:glycosyltransferase family 2 protein [Natronosporangium hydrolyticum]QSB13795.1 glycosyltransferase [Natronosporangium hydrolyticum]
MGGALPALVAGFHLTKTVGLLDNLASFPVLGRRPSAAPPLPRVSLLVPARDEADRLPRCLPGLLAQPAAEVLVCDDESTDDTAGVVRRAAADDPRLRLVPGTPRPPGWIGKSWACHQLAAAATGDLLVFCDADVLLQPGALAALWAELTRQRSEVFSVFPRQQTGTLGERLLVPLIDEVLLSFLPHRLLSLPVPAAATANGQLLAFRRSAYQAIGGHRAVADRIVEDLALGRLARRRGLRLGLALGGDLVSARMYDGYPQTVRGLGKSMREAHGDRDALLLASLGWHLLAYTVPWLRWRSAPGWRLAATLSVAQRLLVNAKTGRGSPWEALLVPVTAPAAIPVYLLAARRRARWRGRSYP